MEPSMTRTPPQGWGADLDRAQRPAVPMEAKPKRGGQAAFQVNNDLQNLAPQTPQIKVFKSIERPVMTPVFGTSVPPRGVSGQMRAFAYRFSEARLAHWMTLLAADRVDMIEGIIEDFKAGHVPNIFAEMGLGAELKYNRQAMLRRALYGAGAVAVGLWLFRSSRFLGKARKFV